MKQYPEYKQQQDKLDCTDGIRYSYDKYCLDPLQNLGMKQVEKS